MKQQNVAVTQIEKNEVTSAGLFSAVREKLCAGLGESLWFFYTAAGTTRRELAQWTQMSEGDLAQCEAQGRMLTHEEFLLLASALEYKFETAGKENTPDPGLLRSLLFKALSEQVTLKELVRSVDAEYFVAKSVVSPNWITAPYYKTYALEQEHQRRRKEEENFALGQYVPKDTTLYLFADELLNPHTRDMLEDLLREDPELRLCITNSQIVALRKTVLHLEIEQAQAGKAAMHLLESWAEKGVLSPLVDEDEPEALIKHLAQQEKKHAVWLAKPSALVDKLYATLPKAVQQHIRLACCKQKKLSFFRADSQDEIPAPQREEVIKAPDPIEQEKPIIPAGSLDQYLKS